MKNALIEHLSMCIETLEDRDDNGSVDPSFTIDVLSEIISICETCDTTEIDNMLNHEGNK